MMPPAEQRGAVLEAVRHILSAMNLNCQVELREETQDGGKEALHVAIYTPEHARFLIGKNGQNLQSMEHIVRAMFSKNGQDVSKTILLDVNDYKKSRASQVLELVKAVVTRVRNTKKAEALMPMSSYERRVVHMELASMPDIATESVGQEPQRRVIIKPYNP